MTVGSRRSIRSIRVRITILVTVVFAALAGATALGTLALVDRSLQSQVSDRSDELAAETQAALIRAQLSGEDFDDPFLGLDELYIAREDGSLVSVETGQTATPTGDFVVIAGAGSELLIGDEGREPELVETEVVQAEVAEANRRWEECLADRDVYPPTPEDEMRLPPEELDELWFDFEQQVAEIGEECDRFLPPEELVALDTLAWLGQEFAPTGDEFLTPFGAAQVVAAGSLDEASASLSSVRGTLAVVVPVLIVAVGALVWFATGRALAPVGAMTEQVNAITDTTLHERVPVPPSRDEIAELASTMNAMLDRLEAAAVRQQEFVSDSSHELRTPVAAIRAELEVALAQIESDPTDSPDWPAVARRVLAEDDRLAGLVDDLLLLARQDEGSVVPDTEVDLDDLVYEQARRARPLPVDVSAVSPARVRGASRDLDRAIGHLLDNAARHGRTGVWVTLGTDGGWVRLQVGDDGLGVPIEDRTRVFERFARLEEGRSRERGRGRAGPGRGRLGGRPPRRPRRDRRPARGRSGVPGGAAGRLTRSAPEDRRSGHRRPQPDARSVFGQGAGGTSDRGTTDPRARGWACELTNLMCIVPCRWPAVSIQFG